MAWSIYEYNNALSGLLPQCDADLAGKIEARVFQLMKKGNQAREPVSKALGNGLFEMKADAKGKHVRLFFIFKPGRKIVFVSGAFKDQPKITSEIQKARDIKDMLDVTPELIDGLTEIH